jgi:hypothetical protein
MVVAAAPSIARQRLLKRFIVQLKRLLFFPLTSPKQACKRNGSRSNPGSSLLGPMEQAVRLHKVPLSIF